MDAVAEAREIVGQGRFAEASRRLETLGAVRLDASAVLLKAAVHGAIGEYDRAEALAAQVLRSKILPDLERSFGEYTLSRVAAAAGDRRKEFEHLQKSLTHAERCGDLERVGWAQLRLLTLEDPANADVCASSMSRLRRTASCAGDPSLTAALHLATADLEGMLGLLAKSQRHVVLAQSILNRYPNVWLSGWAENTLLALSLIQCDVPAAVEHGNRALALGLESGAAVVIRHSYANLGRLQFTTGDFTLALDYLRRALPMAKENSEAAFAIVDSMARVHMAQGQLSEAEKLTAWVTGGDRSPIWTGGYIYRHSLLTRAEILGRLPGRQVEAAECFSKVLEYAQRSGDALLQHSVTLLADERQLAGTSDARSSSLSPRATRHLTPDTAIAYERALMCRLLVAGDDQAAFCHFERAINIARSVTNRPAEADIERSWREHRVDLSRQLRAPTVHSASLQDFASLLMHAGRPELLATSLVAILQNTDGISGARAVARASDNTEHDIASCGTSGDTATTRTFALGTSRGRNIELHVHAPLDVESQATVNSIGFIIAAALELERARLDREERQTLWPVDELPAEDDDSVVAGKMRDVMIYTRKIAQANVTVLVTGESGTGKEVLARAVHRYSARSKKPFIPFNCTAVPRELLESHLFGFKRGAFTGADRDNQGLIRAAKDGTLFLDEIGELGLDLQPKLLRFLESGEIHPLGETSPFSVNVRIVAATNADLQKLVAEGRFREDLYYRLNVIPITLPPLRERREEIPPLAQYFALKWSHDLGKGCIRVAEDLMEHLVLHPWPGNIRQLSNEIHRMVAIADPNTRLTLDHLPRALRVETEILKRKANGLEIAVSLTDSLDRAVSTLEREMIKVALRTSNGKVDPAAKALGISRKGLYLKRQRFGL